MTGSRVAALRRFPRLWWRETEVWPPVTPEEQARYANLADDFAVLDDELVPAFVELDGRAQREQNRFRRQQILIFLGGFVSTVASAAQAALVAAWPGLVVAVTGAGVATLTFVARQRRSRRSYLHARLRAEQLRSVYFLFLGRVDRFADPGARRGALVAAVEAIKYGEEPP